MASLVRRSGRAGGRRDDGGGGHVEVRTFYIFDFERAAVLLIGGDKTGDERFYDRMIPIAERIWEQYKRERGSK
ncbi:MAG TPA: type II toxin-antitoxin system RelE/ParE family toxin [Polyangia bacterium]|nr:type II toxin-antitoxin system RelE/ParE family toxin [Polyangia bacterium]